MRPQEGRGAWMPMPRKLSPDSSRTMVPNWRESITRMGATCVGPPADPAGHEAHEDTRHGGDQYGADGQGERDSPAVEESREDVPAEVIGAEHVPARAAQAPGRSEALAEARLERIIRSQGGGEKAGEDHQPQERAADHHRRIAAPEASDRHGLELGRHHEYRMRG